MLKKKIPFPHCVQTASLIKNEFVLKYKFLSVFKSNGAQSDASLSNIFLYFLNSMT
jgi:hypothetical protein